MYLLQPAKNEKMPYPVYMKRVKAQKKRERRERRDVRESILPPPPGMMLFCLPLQLLLAGTPVPKKKERPKRT